MNVPSFLDIECSLGITQEVQLIVLMLNHVTVFFNDDRKKFIHRDSIPVMACEAGECKGKTLSEYTDTLKSCESTFFEDCSCDAHQKLQELERVDYDDIDFQYLNMLGLAQELDISKDLKDQSGAQVVMDLFNFALYRAKISGRFYAKAQYLESSVLCYDSKKNQVVLYNSRADFIEKHGSKRVISAVGEVESSPYIQMVVAGMGHLGNPDVRYLLGLVLSHTRHVSLYWIESDINVKVIMDTAFYGPVRLKALTTDSFNLCDSDQLHDVLVLMVKALKYINIEYKNRMQSIADIKIPDDPVATPPVRKSDRKRKSSTNSPVPHKK